MPPVKETFKPSLRLVRAAWVVRTLACVAMRMPMFPASAENTAPITKGHHDEPVRGFHHGGDEAEEGAGDDDEHGQDAVFRAQEGQGAFVDVLGDFAHAGFAGALLANPSGLNGHDDQSEDGQARYEVEQRLLHR